MQLDIGTLREAVATKAALRRRQRLQPVGGQGDKIFPPTYPGEGRNAQPRHVYERRRLNGSEAWCVLVDSVQSQANRLEECLLAAIGEGLPVPHVVVDFTAAKLDGITRITSLDAPHRVYDAILRDSLLGSEPFMKSAVGQRLTKAKAEDASALLEISPTALLFGAWHSTGEGGGLGAKFARCLVSEIIAIDVPVEEGLVNQRTGEMEMCTAGRRTGSRIDPLGVLRKVDVFKGDSGWATTEGAAGKNAKKVRPSEINHGNIAPSVQPLGITCDSLEHSFVLSFAALRRLRFGEAPDKDVAGRTLLAALGLLALTEQDARGYALRSRCDLVCDGQAPLNVVAADGTTEPIEIGHSDARALYEAAVMAARGAGFAISAEPLRLTPQEKLVDIVRQSQRLALAGEGGEEGGADTK
ncbi:MAG: type I-U CRISPR-associated protein Cas7 [Rhodospirillales bacterium]|nr:type I-U CRISPR-associated protein Cas7 [Rhodospirillales bacterium]